jgi:hypothetical protein
MRLQTGSHAIRTIFECFAGPGRKNRVRPYSTLDSTKKTDLGWGVPKNSGSCAAIRVLAWQESQWRHEVS